MKIHVVKIGGSLLRRPDLLGDFQTWCQSALQDTHRTLLIVGGGEMINAVREWDALRPGDPRQVHWRCVEMLRFSFESMRAAFEDDPRWGPRWGPRCDHVASIETARQWQRLTEEMRRSPGSRSPGSRNPEPRNPGKSDQVENERILVNVPAFYTPETNRESEYALPENWQTTTDAIAFWLTHQIGEILRTSSGSVPDSQSRLSIELTLLKSCKPPSQATIPSLIQAGIIDPACGVFADSPVTMNVQQLPG